MTTDRYRNFRPDRPGPIKTTQRVNERLDWADGYDDDEYYNLFAKEVVPQYENKVDSPPREPYDDIDAD